MSESRIIEVINQNKVIAIVRKQYGESLLNLAKALYAGGIRLIECTFDQADCDCIARTSQSIKALKSEFGGEMYVGAGTVLNEEQVLATYYAGGQFIISPNVSTAVIYKTKSLGMVSIPGAMTPTEILVAHDSGADFVKLFPANTLGLQYAKDIMAPISHVKLIATGGITENNYEEYLKIGFAGAGVSSSLTSKALVSDGKWEELTRRAEAFSNITHRYI